MKILDRLSAVSKWSRLIPKLSNDRFRNAYFEKTLKSYLATQIRAIRGDETQKEFGNRVGMTQSVVSRLEDENYGKVNAQTLIDLAKKLNLAVIIKFVDYATFLRSTDDLSDAALRPRSFDARSLADDLQTGFGQKPLQSKTVDAGEVEGTTSVSMTSEQLPTTKQKRPFLETSL